MIRYRTSGAWGPGIGMDLSPAQVDENFYTIDQRIVVLEALPPPAPGISHFEIDGDQLTVVMTDSSTRGPYTLPVVTMNFRGSWLPETEYLAGDIITHGSTIYVVLLTHTSEAVFDPGLQIGSDDVYGFGLTVSGTLPAGGAEGQWLRKATGVDYEVEWADAPIPAGGDAGDVLTKLSSTDYDSTWAPASGLFAISDAADAETGDPEHGDVLRWSVVAQEWEKTKENPPVTVSGTTLTLSEGNLFAFNLMTSSSGCSVTVPPESSWTANVLTAGAVAHFRQASATGPLDFLEGSGVTINGIEGFFNATNRQGAVATLYYEGSNTWSLYGLLAEAS